MGALWMVLAAFFFSTMAMGVKMASHSFGLFELVFFRGFISILFMGTVMRVRGTALHTPVPMMHLTRNVAGVMSLSSWFYAIAHLPLATAMTLNYMSSVWVAAFIIGGALLYGKAEKQGPLLFTVLMGFAGVVLTLRPTFDHDQLFAGVIGLMSGMGSALAYMQVAALGRLGEPDERTVFYFSIGTCTVGLIGIAFNGITPWGEVRWQDAAWIVPIGVLASLGQWCMTRAYRKGATLVVASMQYSGIVFASVYSITLFGDHIAPMGWLGIAVIMTSGVMATLIRAKVMPGTPAEDH
jgi:S-adenosylmethionine uptake transporter